METTEEKPSTDGSKSKVSGSSDEKDEKAPDSSENNSSQKLKTNKPKKRKKPKDVTAPRQPLTGYVRYLNDRRESVRAANPNLPFAEITRLLASEWTNLPADKKQSYLDAAVLDKERYTKEYNAYKQTQAYKSYTKQVSEKKLKENKDELKAVTVPKESHSNEIDMGNFDIPIFTEEFLDHNKTRDAELRQLKKSNTDYEQQNSRLQKHIEDVKGAIEKLEVEILQQRKKQ
uniref:HMG box domain-containing protein n=1 Tax=Photinus pyralis TaxID=7054 RepID=A0A1Y1N7V9_PHOPY